MGMKYPYCRGKGENGGYTCDISRRRTHMKSEVKTKSSIPVKSHFFASQDDRWPC
jgi:hypothetical protein